jgi:hypothetical protein
LKGFSLPIQNNNLKKIDNNPDIFLYPGIYLYPSFSKPNASKRHSFPSQNPFIFPVIIYNHYKLAQKTGFFPKRHSLSATGFTFDPQGIFPGIKMN